MGMLAAGALALAKFKFLLLGSLKTGLSMFVMIWFYSLAFGWPFAVGFVVLIFVHEMGHVIAAWMLGMPVTAPIFIPFVGAYITMVGSADGLRRSARRLPRRLGLPARRPSA
jgi:Zn-dependent protease